MTISVSGTQYSEIYGNLNPGSVTLIATKGTPVQIATDYMGDTVSSCHLTLISNSRGMLFDGTSPAGSTGCPTPKAFKVAGAPGTVEFFVIEETLTYTDSSGAPQRDQRRLVAGRHGRVVVGAVGFGLSRGLVSFPDLA